eukprot:5797455-Alexandrium_andersonii.AAC.1
MPAVRKTRRAGSFEVPSSQAGVSYTVEVDLRASPGTAPAKLARGCGRMGHTKHGPICKHAGVVLHALAAESRVKTKQFPALTASEVGLSPESRARSAEDRRACGPSASRAAGSSPSGLGAAKIAQLKAKARLLRGQRQDGGRAKADGVASLTQQFEQMVAGPPPPASELQGLGVAKSASSERLGRRWMPWSSSRGLAGRLGSWPS